MDKELIQGQDVIRLLLQFCKEHNLVKTFNSLREESDIKDNFVKDLEGFQKAFRAGNWDTVILEMNDMILPRSLLMDVYELILFELCEEDEYDLCRHILKDVLVHKSMQSFTKPSRTERRSCGKVLHHLGHSQLQEVQRRVVLSEREQTREERWSLQAGHVRDQPRQTREASFPSRKRISSNSTRTGAEFWIKL
jgi:hypothetical protein